MMSKVVEFAGGYKEEPGETNKVSKKQVGSYCLPKWIGNLKDSLLRYLWWSSEEEISSREKYEH